MQVFELQKSSVILLLLLNTFINSAVEILFHRCFDVFFSLLLSVLLILCCSKCGLHSAGVPGCDLCSAGNLVVLVQKVII